MVTSRSNLTHTISVNDEKVFFLRAKKSGLNCASSLVVEARCLINLFPSDETKT